MIKKSIFKEYVKSVSKSELLHSCSFETEAFIPKVYAKAGGYHD